MSAPYDRLTAEQVKELETAALPLWDALGALGWVDGHGGSEFTRVFPEVLNFVHGEANPPLVRHLGGAQERDYMVEVTRATGDTYLVLATATSVEQALEMARADSEDAVSVKEAAA